MIPLIKVKGLKKEYRIGKGKVLTAVNDLSFDILPGETLGLVGQSGCGKSTTGRCLLRLEEASEGQIIFDGENVRAYNRQQLIAFRRHAQMIFQDPYSSLNPRMTIEDIIAEPFFIHSVFASTEIQKEVAKLMDLVGLSRSSAGRFPHALSGGQRQRVSIARALALKPRLLICDEPISSLDVSMQAQIVNLLKDLQKEYRLSYLFIAHDLTMVRYLSDRVAVMQEGRIVELATTELLFTNPQHSYTKDLLTSMLSKRHPPSTDFHSYFSVKRNSLAVS